MKNIRIVYRLDHAIKTVIKLDKHLLEHDLSERCIAHRLAMYLTPQFQDYDVDCEYNGDVDNDSQRKRINILKTELERINKEPTEDDKQNPENPLSTRDVYPDIIIHERGKNGKTNLCIIEIKTTTSRKKECLFDDLKLKAYTSDEYGNHLKYQLGVYVNFGVKRSYPNYTMSFYENGKEQK